MKLVHALALLFSLFSHDHAPHAAHVETALLLQRSASHRRSLVY
jgi:hypothetical protein